MMVKTLSAALWGSEILMVFIELRLLSPHGGGFFFFVTKAGAGVSVSWCPPEMKQFMSQPRIFEFVPEPCRVHPFTPLLCLLGCASHRLGCHGDHVLPPSRGLCGRGAQLAYPNVNCKKGFFPPEIESRLPCACWCKHEAGALCWLGGKCKQVCR